MTPPPRSRMDIASNSQIGYAALLYVATTLLRMILTATFVPSADLDTFDVQQVRTSTPLTCRGPHLLTSTPLTSSR